MSNKARIIKGPPNDEVTLNCSLGQFFLEHLRKHSNRIFEVRKKMLLINWMYEPQRTLRSNLITSYRLTPKLDNFKRTGTYWIEASNSRKF